MAQVTIPLPLAKQILQALQTHLHLPMRHWPARTALGQLIKQAEEGENANR